MSEDFEKVEGALVNIILTLALSVIFMIVSTLIQLLIWVLGGRYESDTDSNNTDNGDSSSDS